MPPRLRLSKNRLPGHPALSFLLLAILVGVAIWSLDRYRYRFVRANADVLRLLPPSDATLFYADVDALRGSGYLQLLAGKSADSEYRQFLDETHFDFTKDLDAVACTVSGSQLQLMLKGRFDWSRFRSYATTHGGQCHASGCSLSASHPGQWLSFAEFQPDVMAAAVSPVPDASPYLAHLSLHPEPEHPADPLWIRPAHSILQNSNGLPLALRVLAIALQSAKSVTLALGSSQDAAFDLKLIARYEHATIADTAKNQLERDTRMMKAELAREHAASNPADLTGLFTSGRFWIEGETLYGRWPVQKAFLDSLR